MKLKKVLAVALASLMVFSMTACGNDSSAPASSTAEAPAADDTAEPEAEAPAEDAAEDAAADTADAAAETAGAECRRWLYEYSGRH